MALRETDGRYMTKNMMLAAFLEMRGYNVQPERSKEDPKHKEFWVVIDQDLEALVDKFYNKEAMVEPREFGYYLKSVKDKMYALEGR